MLHGQVSTQSNCQSREPAHWVDLIFSNGRQVVTNYNASHRFTSSARDCLVSETPSAADLSDVVGGSNALITNLRYNATVMLSPDSALQSLHVFMTASWNHSEAIALPAVNSTSAACITPLHASRRQQHGGSRGSRSGCRGKWLQVRHERRGAVSDAGQHVHQS